MKKILLFIAAVFCLCLSCSCSSSPEYLEYVSQIRTDAFFGSGKFFEVVAYSELKETPLVSDGYAGEMSAFLILKVRVLENENMLINGLSADFSLDRDYKVSLPYSAAFDSYVASVLTPTVQKEDFVLTITYGETTENVTMQSARAKGLTANDALKTAIKHKKALVDKLIEDKSPFEIMIRFMTEGDGTYFYVGIVEAEYTTALLISSDGKVLAEKRLKN